MKELPEYIETSIWYKEEITDPYQTIAAFFSGADVVSHKRHIKEAIKSAASNKVCKASTPADILFHFKLVESVINAASLLNKEKKKCPISVRPDNLFNKNLYCGWHSGLTEWDFFPRALSLKEYINPYVVFKRFFKYLKLAEWKRELNDIFEYAIARESLWDAGVECDLLGIYFHLTKLIEAVHLIDVREITHIGGTIKNRFKEKNA